MCGSSKPATAIDNIGVPASFVRINWQEKENGGLLTRKHFENVASGLGPRVFLLGVEYIQSIHRKTKQNTKTQN